MSSSSSLLHLTDSDVQALHIPVGAVRRAVRETFVQYAAGKVVSEPKTSIMISPGHAFQSLSVVDTARGWAALKWVGMVPPGGASNVTINASLLLSDSQTGQLRVLMDARRATALRTAAMTAVAAEHLARRDSSTIGFVGAGVQAEAHLLALTDLLPTLRTVHVNSPADTAERFANRCRELGFEAVVGSAQEVVASSDVLVTSVPLVPGFAPFVDAEWIRPGAFVAAVDLGRSWIHRGLDQVELTVIDEDAMRRHAKPGNFVPSLERADATLSDLVSGRHGGRRSATDRVVLFSSGSAVADLAIAVLIHSLALEKGVGTLLGS